MAGGGQVRATPGVYLASIASTLILFAVLCGAVTVGSGESWESAWVFTYLAGVFATFAAIILGIPFALLVHRLVRHTHRATVHVAVFAAAAMLAAAIAVSLVGLLHSSEPWLLPVLAGISAALARAAVILLIRRSDRVRARLAVVQHDDDQAFSRFG